ncbi:MAG: hypothetical protein HC906_06550 [Bacteroidales bacterium]|nr:hypothetical protein [Bacteroidales bacterium]
MQYFHTCRQSSCPFSAKHKAVTCLFIHSSYRVHTHRTYSGGDRGNEAVVFYLATYIITITGTFGLITMFSANEKEARKISDFKGMFWKRPLLAVFLQQVCFHWPDYL